MSKAPSRAGTKAKEKDKNTKKQTQEKPTASLFEIVPGKFNENDWNNMLDNDQSQEFIWEILDEVLDNTEKIIYENYIVKQTIPYTINEAKNAILHIIDWQFLPCDTNDDINLEFPEDIEPNSAIIDSWAQGYIQGLSEDNYGESEIEYVEETENKNAENKSFLEELIKQDVKSNSAAQLNETFLDEIDEENHVSKSLKKSDSIIRKFSNSLKLKKELSRSLNFEKHVFQNDEYLDLDSNITNSARQPERKSTKARNVENEAKKIEDAISKAPTACHSILKSLLGRPAGYRELEIDANGNVISILKIDSDRLPTNNIRPRFNIIDNVKQDINRLKLKKKKEVISGETFEEKMKKRPVYDELDSMLEPASGVVFKMGKITRIGPKKGSGLSKQQILLQKTENFLKPIRSLSMSEEDSLNRNAIEQILQQQTSTERVKPLNKLRPMPPISSPTSVN